MCGRTAWYERAAVVITENRNWKLSYFREKAPTFVLSVTVCLCSLFSTLAPDEFPKACRYKGKDGKIQEPTWRDGGGKYYPSYNISPQSFTWVSLYRCCEACFLICLLCVLWTNSLLKNVWNVVVTKQICHSRTRKFQLYISSRCIVNSRPYAMSLSLMISSFFMQLLFPTAHLPCSRIHKKCKTKVNMMDPVQVFFVIYILC